MDIIRQFTRSEDFTSVGTTLNQEDKNSIFFYLCGNAANSHIKDPYGEVRWLIQNDVNIDVRNEKDQTGLMLACMQASERSTNQMVKLLIELGADVNAEEDDYNTILFTPLYYAIIQNGDNETVRLLLQAGADPNLPCNDTPLENVVIYQDNLELTELLLQHGANPDEIMYDNYLLNCDGDELRINKLIEVIKIILPYIINVNKLKKYQQFIYEKHVTTGKDQYEDFENEHKETRDKINGMIQERINELTLI